MDLISCKQCSVVLDRDQLIFPDIYDHDTNEVIEENAKWDGNDFIAFVLCPVCDNAIPKED